VSEHREVPVVSFVGKSNVGKTTALVRVIHELKMRGVRVGTIKHDTHGFEVDRPGKDSWRHAQAGSDVVVIAGPRRMAMIRQLERELSLEEIVPLMGDVDLVLTEGYKRGNRPKIEVSRAERGTELLCKADELIAVMADHVPDVPVPLYALEDAAGIADLLEGLILRRPGERET
jgi:molybdopterin-guanine dinucleotide biosynthesis adapter protein